MERNSDEFPSWNPPNLQLYLENFEVWRKMNYAFSAWGPEKKSFAVLDRLYQHLLRDFGESLYNRAISSRPVGILSTETIEIIDGFVRLPPAPELPSDYSTPIQEYIRICPEVLNYTTTQAEATVDTPEKTNFLNLLSLLPSQPEPLSCLHNLRLHFLFRSPSAKLIFVQHALEYLEDNETDVDNQLNESWRSSYSDFCRHRTYDIILSIRGHKALEAVYWYNADQSQFTTRRHRKPYQDTCLGVLHYIVNVIKHANNERRRLGKNSWNAKEKVLIIDGCFPEEMMRLYEFFWKRNLSMDWAESSRKIVSLSDR